MTLTPRLMTALLCVIGVACTTDESANDGGSTTSASGDSAGTPNAESSDSDGNHDTAGDDESTGEPPVDPGLAVYCEGEGSPAIVFESGLGVNASQLEYLAGVLDVDTTICRYNRRGIAPSPDLEEGTRTSGQWRDDLVAWLDYYGVTDPAIFVAHSAGGLTVRMLRDSHPERLAGAVMIETSQPASLFSNLATYPPKNAAAVEAHASGDNVEQWDYLTSAQTLAALDEDFGELPMSVLVAGSFDVLEFETEEERDARYEVWTTAQMDLAALSTASVYMRVEDAGHSIYLTHPELVAAEIERVFAEATD